MNEEAIVGDVIVSLLKRAGNAWAGGHLDLALRLTRGAWQLCDGAEFIDCAAPLDDKAGR